jgi:hypothetical protein
LVGLDAAGGGDVLPPAPAARAASVSWTRA